MAISDTFLALANIDYRNYLENSVAWSPQWGDRKRGFYFCMILIPPGLTRIESLDEYLYLLAKRMEFHVIDFIERHSDELFVSSAASREDKKIAIYQRIREAALAEVSDQIEDDMSIFQVCQIVCSIENNELIEKAFTKGSPLELFPIDSDSFNSDPNEEFADLVQSEVSLEGFLTEVSF